MQWPWKPAPARLSRAQSGRDRHSAVSQGACWYKQQVSPVWQCQTKPCSGSASVLWLELPVTKPRSQGVKRGNSPVRLKSCQCRRGRMSLLLPPSLCGNLPGILLPLTKRLYLSCTLKLFRRLGVYACSAVCVGRGSHYQACTRLKKQNFGFDDTNSLHRTIFNHQCVKMFWERKNLRWFS